MTMDNSSSDSAFEVLTASPKSAVRDYIVEFLGSLVPGVAFLLAFVPAFLLPVGFTIIALFAMDASTYSLAPGYSGIRWYDHVPVDSCDLRLPCVRLHRRPPFLSPWIRRRQMLQASTRFLGTFSTTEWCVMSRAQGFQWSFLTTS